MTNNLHAVWGFRHCRLQWLIYHCRQEMASTILNKQQANIGVCVLGNCRELWLNSPAASDRRNLGNIARPVCKYLMRKKSHPGKSLFLKPPGDQNTWWWRKRIWPHEDMPRWLGNVPVGKWSISIRHLASRQFIFRTQKCMRLGIVLLSISSDCWCICLLIVLFASQPSHTIEPVNHVHPSLSKDVCRQMGTQLGTQLADLPAFTPTNFWTRRFSIHLLRVPAFRNAGPCFRQWHMISSWHNSFHASTSPELPCAGLKQRPLRQDFRSSCGTSTQCSSRRRSRRWTTAKHQSLQNNQWGPEIAPSAPTLRPKCEQFYNV